MWRWGKKMVHMNTIQPFADVERVWFYLEIDGLTDPTDLMKPPLNTLLFWSIPTYRLKYPEAPKTHWTVIGKNFNVSIFYINRTQKAKVMLWVRRESAGSQHYAYRFLTSDFNAKKTQQMITKAFFTARYNSGMSMSIKMGLICSFLTERLWAFGLELEASGIKDAKEMDPKLQSGFHPEWEVIGSSVLIKATGRGLNSIRELPCDSFGTLQWVELMGTPTFEATSTVRALITSMQNPLWRDKERRRKKTDNREICEERDTNRHHRYKAPCHGNRGGGGGCGEGAGRGSFKETALGSLTPHADSVSEGRRELLSSFPEAWEGCVSQTERLLSITRDVTLSHWHLCAIELVIGNNFQTAASQTGQWGLH